MERIFAVSKAIFMQRVKSLNLVKNHLRNKIYENFTPNKMFFFVFLRLEPSLFKTP